MTFQLLDACIQVHHLRFQRGNALRQCRIVQRIVGVLGRRAEFIRVIDFFSVIQLLPLFEDHGADDAENGTQNGTIPAKNRTNQDAEQHTDKPHFQPRFPVNPDTYDCADGAAITRLRTRIHRFMQILKCGIERQTCRDSLGQCHTWGVNARRRG